jgi:L-amino acid N-acyltransferase YncA
MPWRSCEKEVAALQGRHAERAVRPARASDATAIARIYNAAITARTATFETEPRTARERRAWLARHGARHPVLVAVEGRRVVAFAAVEAYRPRACYDGVGEFSVYVAPDRRGTGLGRLVLGALMERCGDLGYWKLVSRVFVENDASRGLCRALGFREVGVYERHARLDGVWRDVVIVERWIGAP